MFDFLVIFLKFCNVYKVGYFKFQWLLLILEWGFCKLLILGRCLLVWLVFLSFVICTEVSIAVPIDRRVELQFGYHYLLGTKPPSKDLFVPYTSSC